MLQHRFIDSARQNPDKIAFIDRSTGRDVSYKQTLLAALILARRFRKLERGRIGIMLPTSAGAALTIIGALMGGRTPVMINYSMGAEKNCRYAQQQCDFKVIVTSKVLLEKIACEQLGEMIFIEDILAHLSGFEKTIALIKSKLPFRSLDNILAVLPYFHVFGLTINLWTPLCLGMTSITYASPLEFKSVANIIKETKPELLVGTPLFLEGYVKQSKPGDFSSIKLTVSGADKCPESLRVLYREKHGIEIFEGYGTTETSPVISANPRNHNKPGSIGIPLPGTEVKIEHLETGDPCGPGEIGKILVKGEGVMQGYLNDLEESSLKIKSGWYDTGDLGYMDEDGYIWHRGRLKRFVKIGGEMISLVMVEEILNELTPEAVQCCAVELPDARRGSKIVAVTSLEIDSQELGKRLAAELPNLALPKKYVVIPEFPRMGSGKTDFRGLTNLVLQMEDESQTQV